VLRPVFSDGLKRSQVRAPAAHACDFMRAT
jgi:hypothetical protein